MKCEYPYPIVGIDNGCSWSVPHRNKSVKMLNLMWNDYRHMKSKITLSEYIE